MATANVPTDEWLEPPSGGLRGRGAGGRILGKTPEEWVEDLAERPGAYKRVLRGDKCGVTPKQRKTLGEHGITVRSVQRTTDRSLNGLYLKLTPKEGTT